MRGLCYFQHKRTPRRTVRVDAPCYVCLSLAISYISQSLKPLLKKLVSAVWNAIHSKYIRIIFIASVIFFPCHIQANPVERAKVDFKFLNSPLVLKEFSFDDSAFNFTSRGDKETMEFVPLQFHDRLDIYDRTESFSFGNEILSSVSTKRQSVTDSLEEQPSQNTENARDDNPVKPPLLDRKSENPFDHEPWEYPWFWVLWCFWWLIIFPNLGSGRND